MLLWRMECMYIFKLAFWVLILHIDIYTPKSIFLVHIIVLFLVFWGTSYCFPSDYINLHSYQQCTSVCFSPHPPKPFFFLIAILIGVRWYLIVVLIGISLMISNVEHIFMCLLAIWRFSFGNCLLGPSDQFLIRLYFIYWLLWAVCIFSILIPCEAWHLQILYPMDQIIFLFCQWFLLLCKRF